MAALLQLLQVRVMLREESFGLRIVPAQHTTSVASDSAVHIPKGRPTLEGATRARTPPALLQDVYINQLVAFTSEKEVWMKSNVHKAIGSASIIGRVVDL
ncbi:Hypothetical protein PHPALM_18344 [Phytophthora palmivora]|uniref:Uncharacterized protein n=1 Tax=Phytophthora palmivora TaxID=4796 RepID=A0A2P4XJZ6_9STRA|nr:Hypothetical protein PHPALM_18344 [Phytophthora palmivora]